MLEHLSSFRRKNSDSASSPASSNDKQSDVEHKDMNDIEPVNNKSRNSIFKNLISDNGATNIFQNLIKCPENITSHLNSAMSSSSNGNHKTKPNEQDDDDNSNNQPVINTIAIVQQPPAAVEPAVPNGIHKKRNSTVKMLQNSNGDINISPRELSPSLRVHRKSAHDIRLLRNNQLLGDNGENLEVGKLAGGKPLKTKNIITRNETFDTLHCRAMDVSITIFSHLIQLIMHQNPLLPF